MEILAMIFRYFLSYVFPIGMFIVWLKFMDGNYKPSLGITNWIYFILTMVTLTYQHRALGDLIAFPLLMVVMGVFFTVTYTIAYFTGKAEGVKFWNSFIWKLIKITGHPILIYPGAIIVSIILDFNLLPKILAAI